VALPSSPSRPNPSPLAWPPSRGTGEVNCVYHIAFEELVAATDAAGTAEQKKVLDELVTQTGLRTSFASPRCSPSEPSAAGRLLVQFGFSREV
jgi:hypothetical protein